MHVASAQIAASAQHVTLQKSVEKASLALWVGERRSGVEQASFQSPLADKLTLTPQAQACQPVSNEVSVGDRDKNQELSPHDRLILDILRRMIKEVTGKEPQLLSPGDWADKMAEAKQSADETSAALQQAQQSQASGQQNPPSAGFGMVYDHYESHYEYEAVSFSAQGVIKTQDGKEIQFSVQLNLSREFYTENRETLRLGDAAKKTDPLVVNFDGNAAQLSDSKFQFDLDSDGRKEQISLLKPGSGLLALDDNGDGEINDGSELFGPKTSNGFAELAAHDEDKNGFIDEGDSIYHKLRIWVQDGQGNQQLMALGEKGIGAIYLGHLATPFTHKNDANVTQGDVASTGLFLRENGSAGTIQQIDYAA